MHFKVCKIAFFHVHDWGIVENGMSWLLNNSILFLKTYIWACNSVCQNRCKMQRMKWADLCETEAGKPRVSSISGSLLLWQPGDFHGLHILLYLWGKAWNFQGTAWDMHLGKAGSHLTNLSSNDPPSPSRNCRWGNYTVNCTRNRDFSIWIINKSYVLERRD